MTVESQSKYLEDYRQMERADFTHFSTMGTRWGDADAFGHINNILFARYFESARIQYFSDLLNLQFVNNTPSGMILADLKLAYLQQLHHPAELEVGSRVSRLGNTSMEMDAAIFIKGEDQPVNCSRAVLVWFDYVANKTQPIPDDARKKIVEFEQVKPI